MSYTDYTINRYSTIKEALIKLNLIVQDMQVLMILDDEAQVVGTLSDGDIRRGLIAGANLTDKVESIMHTDFKYVLSDDLSVSSIKRLRETKILVIPVLDNQHHVVDVINLETYKSRLPIDAVLMAGGKGERLRPLTLNTPKPLLKVGDKCIIDHNIDSLISYGIEHISVTVNYLREQIEEHYASPRNGVMVKTCREPEFRGTIGAIKFVPNFYNDTILVMNSDLLTDIDYEDFFLHFQLHDADMSVAAVPYNVSIPYGVLDLDGRNIKGVIEKPKYDYYANGGIYLIKRSALDFVPEDKFFNATDLLEALVSANKRVIRYPLRGTWIDIGNPQEYNRANELVKHSK
jgi:dTDP-glucose pyrophosphorylase